MKKTLLFLCFIAAMTFVLAFSGVSLLALVDRLEPEGYVTASAGSQIGDDGAGNGQDGVEGGWTGAGNGVGGQEESDGGGSSGLGQSQKAASFYDVLRGYKQSTGDPVNVLVLASDVGGANTDAIMVVHLDPKTSQINILSVPRDTYVTVDGLKSHKVNSIYNAKNGAGRLMQALESMLGQPVEYYVHMDIATIREIVDLLDGVEYFVPCDLKRDDPTQDLHINIKKGLQTLDGEQVEGLLRFRYPNKWTDEVKQYYDGSDLKRIERQQDFLNAFIKQKVSVKYLGKANDIVAKVYESITTDLPLSQMLTLAKCLPGVSQERFVTAMLPGVAKTIDGVSYYVHSEKQSKALADVMLADVPAATAAPTEGL